MNVENLLNAAVELEKRIATDRLLRNYFSAVWKGKTGTQLNSKSASSPPEEAQKNSQMTFRFPEEMREWLDVAATATGKTPGQLLEESFAEYCAKNAEKWNVKL